MNYKIGDNVVVNGRPKYTSYGGSPGAILTNYKGKVTHINNKSGVPYPVHVDKKGWFAESELGGNTSGSVSSVSSSDDDDLVLKKISTSYQRSDETRNKARRTYISVIFENRNISTDLNKYLISFEYTDNEEDTADDINIKIDDKDNIWLKWLKGNGKIEAKGCEIKAFIVKENWNMDGRSEVLDCGIFECDTIDVDGPPQTISLKASSISQSSKLKNEKKSKVWENATLEEICSEISKKAGYGYFYDTMMDITYEGVEQVNESDIGFLQRLCKKSGISLKITSKTIVLFDQTKYENKASVKKISKMTSDLYSWNFSSKTVDTHYKKCHVKYTDSKTKKTYEYTFTPKNADPKGETLEVKGEKVASNEEARKLAMKKLREKNKEEFTASFTMPGDVKMVAGCTVEVDGWYAYDGKYIIEAAKHTLSRSGYITDITVRKVLEEY